MTILIFAPHPDDEVIGCGGTIARYVAEGEEVHVCVVTRGKPPVFNHSRRILEKHPHDLCAEVEKSNSILGIKKTHYFQFPAAMLESVPRYELNKKTYDLINKLKPDVVYIPHFGDLHKDHALTSKAVMVAVRPKDDNVVRAVYSYETLSESEWNIPHAANKFIPNVYVDISMYLNKKLEAMKCFRSQICEFPNPRSIEAITALAKYRGSTMGTLAAEVFMLVREYRKVVKEKRDI
jgi:LmbE family N-acetylglucosaminyl deacetylase